MKKNNITELVFIIDRSGSMSDLTSDTIGGFNSMISKQKKIDGECFVTTILFDDRLKTLHDRVPLLQIKPMNENDYCPYGCTALIDAIGYGVEHTFTNISAPKMCRAIQCLLSLPTDWKTLRIFTPQMM